MNLAPAALRRALILFIAAAGLLLAGCDYTVPLSAKPDRKIDERLLGEWISPSSWMKVRRFDAENYVVYHNGTAFRAWHSPVAGLPLLTVQELESKPGSTKFAYLSYDVTGDGQRLNLRVVRDEVVSKKINDTAAMRQAVEQHARHPELLTEEIPFSRMK